MMPDWSLALEMQFYLAFPFLALLARRAGYARFFFVCCSISAATNYLIHYYDVTGPGPLGWYPQPTLLPLKLHVFAVGIVAAGILCEGPAMLRSGWFWAGMVLFITTCRYNYTRVLAAGYGVAALLCLTTRGFAGVCSLIKQLEFWCRRTRWFHWPAELSYSCYLIHNIVFGTVFTFVVGAPQTHRALWFPLFLGGMLVLINGMGFLLHVLIEKPGIRLGKRLLQISTHH
jgi:peptidoglycan/LPS O-acetylase OafA/YrhL